MNRSIILPALVTAFVALSPAGVAVADNPHDAGDNRPTPRVNRTRKPSPGPCQASTAPGSRMRSSITPGSGTTSANRTGNIDKAVSQYDVAGFQWCQHHPDSSSC